MQPSQEVPCASAVHKDSFNSFEIYFLKHQNSFNSCSKIKSVFEKIILVFHVETWNNSCFMCLKTRNNSSFKYKKYGIIPVFMLLKHEIIPEKVLTVRFFVSLQIFKSQRYVI